MSRWMVSPVAGLLGVVTMGALAAAPYAEGGRAMVSSDHILASRAGLEMLEAGGNAMDAAVATALAAGVVQPAGSGLGGGGFAVGSIDKETFALDFREVAPANATEDMFRVGDKVDNKLSRHSGAAVAVPGESRGLAKLLTTHGTMSHSAVAAPAVRLASKGFEVGPHFASSLRRSERPEIKTLFADVQYASVHKRPGLAKVLQKWGSTKGEDLHTGAGAEAIAAASQRAMGVITTDDMAAYKPVERKPLVGSYGDYTVVTMPLPSSGGVVLLQALRVLETADLKGMGLNSSDYVHHVSEVLKHAYADRAHHMGDPDFVDVPVAHLLSDERIDEVRRSVYPTRTFPPEHYGELIAPLEDDGTQHISVVDTKGDAVALTTTVNGPFGSGVVAGKTEIVLNNQMDDFAAAPGVPNMYGLVGNAANRIEPGKRPLSSMSPTLILDKNGHVVMSIGASGGSFIISSTLQVILDVLVFEMDPQEAVATPRFHHQWQPDSLFLEPGFAADVKRSLEGRGHEITEREGFSAVQVVAAHGAGWWGGADPRKSGWPAALQR